MQCVFDVVQDRNGTAISGAYVAVYDSNNALATIYSDDGITTTPNPTITNSDGEYQFYAANGKYSIVITATGYTGQTIPGVVLFDASDTATAAAYLQSTGLTSNAVGFRTIPQRALISTGYTLVAADSGRHIYMAPIGGGTIYIPANSSVAFPLGTAVTFINGASASITIAINTDTMTLANSTTTGNRTLAQNGIATAVKIGSTSWLISGSGLT